MPYRTAPLRTRRAHLTAPATVAAVIAALGTVPLAALEPGRPHAHHVPKAGAMAASTVPVVRARVSGSPLRWSDPGTWGGTLPAAGTHVVIPVGSMVVLDRATAPLSGLTVEGLLVADESSDIAVTSDFILVTGELRVGTALRRYERQATITLTGTSVANPLLPAAVGNKTLVVQGGVLSLHGRSGVTSGWTHLAVDAAAGSTRLTLATSPGWRVGDRIVIATSSPNQQHHDVAIIAAINGPLVTLAAPLRWPHDGTMRTAGGVSIDMRAEVGLLSRNIVVQGDASSVASGIGGHAMFMDGAREATIQLAAVEFRHMGQLNRLGRYPVHFHLMGATTNCYLRDIAVHTTIQRGVVLHGTRGVLMTGSVVYNTVGHNVVIEDGEAVGNTLDRNLALVNRQPSPLPTNPTLREQNDRLPANFWFKAAGNTVVRNAAAGSFDSGIIYDFVVPSGNFDLRHNTAHGAMALAGAGEGDFDIMAGILVADGEPRPPGDVIRGNLVYHNAVGFWPEEAGEFVIDSLIAVENVEQTVQRDAMNRVRYRDPLFVGALTNARLATRVNLRLQYGTHVVLERPHFVNTNGIGLASVSDAANGAGVVRAEGLRLTNSSMDLGIGDDNLIVSLDNDVLAPRGVYLFNDFNAAPDCRPVQLPTVGGELEPLFHCPRLPALAQLDVRDRAAPTVRQFTRRPLRRSDGLLVRDGELGYHIVTNAGLGYAMESGSASGYAYRIDQPPPEAGGPPPDRGVIRMRVPVASPPTGVWRSGWGRNPPTAPASTSALRAASSQADFDANPLTSYLFDPVARTVTASANVRWLVIHAPAPTVSAMITCNGPAAATTNSAGVVLDYARALVAQRPTDSLMRTLARATTSCR